MNSENLLFSVFILTYNSNPRKLKLTLDSVLAQKYQNYEVIISDDGSCAREHLKIISDYECKFRKVKILINNTNLGIVENLRKTLKETSGELIMGLSPGDALYSKDTLSYSMHYYLKNKPLFFIGFIRSYYLDKNSRIRDSNFLAPSPDHLRFLNCSDDAFGQLLFGNFICPVGLVRTKRSTEEEKLQIPEGIKYLEDWPFFLLASYYGYQIPIFNCFVEWYEYGSGISTQGNKEWAQKLRNDWIFFLEWLLVHGTDDKKNILIRKELEFLKMATDKIGFVRKLEKLVYCLFNFPQRIPRLTWKKINLLSEKNARHRANLLKLQGEGFLDSYFPEREER